MRDVAKVIAVALLCGCGAETSSSLDFELEAINPDFADNRSAVRVEIAGRYFHPKVSQQLESGGSLTIDESFAVVLVPGDGSRSPVSLEQVTYLDKKTLSAKVPEGVANGMYDVVVTDPYGATSTLSEGYMVGECRENEHCSGATPRCNTDSGRCAECVVDADCGSAAPRCDPDSSTCVVCLEGSEQACEALWWNDNWSYRVKITFDNAAQDEHLFNFPVYVGLTDSAIDLKKTHPDGSDIRFVDADGVTELFHEIEDWQDESYGHVWVNVPQIHAGSDSDYIWMYYGNSGASDPGDAEQTWNANYEVVYHFDGSDVTDSTANGFDGTPHGVTWAPAVVGSGSVFGGDDYIDLASDLPLLMDANGGTLSAWIYPSGVNDEQYFISVSVNNAGLPTQDSRAVLGLWNGVAVMAGGNTQDSGALVYLKTDTEISPVAWQHVAATLDYENRMIDIYHNSSHVASAAVDFVSQSTPDTVATSTVIGADDDGQDDFFKGSMDEVRISRTVRSANWIRAQYLSMTNSFVQFGPEQELP